MRDSEGEAVVADERSSEPLSKGLVLTIIGLILFGLGYRVVEAQKSFWLDELHTTELAHVGPQRMLEKLGEDFHAPLYFLAVGWMEALGLEGHGLRSISILFSMLSLWPLLMIARSAKISGYATVALVGVVMLAPFQIRYGAELRPYSLVAFFALLMVWAAFDSERPFHVRWAIFALTAALALFTHYLAAALIIAIGFVRLFVRPAGSIPVFRLILAGTLGVLLFLPWILTMESWIFSDPEALVRSDQVKQVEMAEPEDLPGFGELKEEVLLAFPRAFSPSMNSLGGSSKYVVMVGTGLALAVIGFGLLSMLRRIKISGQFFGAASCGLFTMSIIGLLCVQFWHRIPIQYFAIGAWMWAFLAAIAIDGLRTNKMRSMALTVLLIGLVLAATGEVSGEPRENLESAVRQAVDLAKEENAHLTCLMRQPKQYTNTEVFRVYHKSAAAIEPTDVPEDDGRSVVVMTRRVSLEAKEGEVEFEDSIRKKRKLKRSIVVGRAIKIYLFESR
ncbi:MAG: hypothetical protein ACI97A_001011 [Planctomycetota bacterium]|jgi:hypothetical protein